MTAIASIALIAQGSPSSRLPQQSPRLLQQLPRLHQLQRAHSPRIQHQSSRLLQHSGSGSGAQLLNLSLSRCSQDLGDTISRLDLFDSPMGNQSQKLPIAPPCSSRSSYQSTVSTTSGLSTTSGFSNGSGHYMHCISNVPCQCTNCKYQVPMSSPIPGLVRVCCISLGNSPQSQGSFEGDTCSYDDLNEDLNDHHEDANQIAAALSDIVDIDIFDEIFIFDD